ncbi:MAG: aminotransferase class IV [Hyphomicrobiales bacterium]
MCRFLETIKYHDGQFFRQSYHNKRFNRTRKKIFELDKIDLFDHIQVPEALEDTNDVYKVRVEYDKEIQRVEFLPYVLKDIKSLRVVKDNNIDYQFKYMERSPLNTLFDKREDCDDVLIVKNGLLSDTSYCNIALFDGSMWFTPSAPLLKGVQRSYLLEFGLIHEDEIQLRDLKFFKKIRLFNSMIEWTDCMDIKRAMIK